MKIRRKIFSYFFLFNNLITNIFKLSKHMISDLCAICLENDEHDRTSFVNISFIYFFVVLDLDVKIN